MGLWMLLSRYLFWFHTQVKPVERKQNLLYILFTCFLPLFRDPSWLFWSSRKRPSSPYSTEPAIDDLELRSAKFLFFADGAMKSLCVIRFKGPAESTARDRHVAFHHDGTDHAAWYCHAAELSWSVIMSSFICLSRTSRTYNIAWEIDRTLLFIDLLPHRSYTTKFWPVWTGLFQPKGFSTSLKGFLHDSVSSSGTSHRRYLKYTSVHKHPQKMETYCHQHILGVWSSRFIQSQGCAINSLTLSISIFI